MLLGLGRQFSILQYRDENTLNNQSSLACQSRPGNRPAARLYKLTAIEKASEDHLKPWIGQAAGVEFLHGHILPEWLFGCRA